jgi:protein-disulfide isomerase
MRPDASKKLAAVAPKKGPNPVVIGAVVGVLVIVAVVAAIVIGGGGNSGGGSAVPTGALGGDGAGIVASKTPAKSGAPTVDIFEDFQCPVCGQFEKAFGATLTSMADAGEVKLVVHTLSFLDSNLKNDSSSRSANAVACASDAGKFLEYHSAVFAAQPVKEGDGYTDAQLTEFATTSGITGPALTTWQKCASSGQHAKYVTDVQTAAEKEEVFGTPTVKLNGKDITKSLSTPDTLIGQIKAATK